MAPDRVLIKSIPFDKSLFELVAPALKESGVSLLDSASGFGDIGRYSIFGREPFAVFSSEGIADPLTTLKRVLSLFSLLREERGLPFTGGAIGWFSYDLGRTLERIPTIARPLLGFPDIHLFFYDSVLVYDHAENTLHLCATDARKEGGAKLQARMDRLEAWVSDTARQVPESTDEKGPAGSDLCSNFTRETYCDAVRRIKEHIADGDIYQANLSQAFSFALNLRPDLFFRRIRRVTPAPFSTFINAENRCVASFSPERFLQLRGNSIETRPIKGTRPRGRTPEEDLANRRELLESAKDRAELTMIVDLERNDLGRVAEIGSVETYGPPVLETYADVHHLVSTVRGRLRPECTAVDIIRAAFPGGSITGAPKIRAMEIIESLEPTRRSLYTGAIGYLGFDGDMDLNIAIRTVLCENNCAVLQAGGGIVADSDPELEYEETLHKVRGVLRAVGPLGTGGA